MINLKSVNHLLDNKLYYELINDLQILNTYFPNFIWVVDYEYPNLLRIDTTNTKLNIRFYWDEDCNILCTVNDFEVAANCNIRETIELLKSNLIEKWIIK